MKWCVQAFQQNSVKIKLNVCVYWHSIYWTLILKIQVVLIVKKEKLFVLLHNCTAL